MRRAILFLEDGFWLEGESFTIRGETIGEVVFNTSMSGYEEILTDPSYRGQIVCMSYPLIGNYGISGSDIESRRVQVEGFIVRENSQIYSNFQAKKSLSDYLRQNKILALEHIDTRALVRHLRLKGSLKGIISTEDFNFNSLRNKLAKAPSIVGRDLVRLVSCRQVHEWREDWPQLKFERKHTVAVIDCGIKHSILRFLKSYFEKVVIFPYESELKDVLRINPQAILFSNGPGDPQAVKPAIELAGKIISGLRQDSLKLAVMGICLGHQILGLALGGKSRKLKFGHHGGNHPVKDLATGKIDITAQNHNFIVDTQGLPDKDVVQTHINLYDNTPEGLRHRKLPLFSVQFHPEAGPGPFDAQYIFSGFRKMTDKIFAK